jgi:all-trans-retinol 13,14-reductase
MANVGIRGTAEELGLECCNLWPQPAGDNQSIFDGVRNYLNDPLGVPTTEIPLMITFPTLKDRGLKQDTEYQTAQLLALAKTEWFTSISDTVENGTVDSRTPAWKHPERNEDYKKLKQRWSERLQEAFLIYYPQLKGKIEFFDLATPLSIEHYLPTGSGSAIGLDVNAGPSCRFTNFDTMKLLDMKTPVPGLWITGQDSLLCGVPLAQAAGLITALRIAGPMGMARIVLQTIWLLLASFGDEVRSERSAEKKNE